MKLVSQLHGRFGVEPVLRVLGIAPSTYYGWVQRQADPSQHQHADEELVAEIVDIHITSGGTYSSPRVHATCAGSGQPGLHGPAPDRLRVADATRIPAGEGVFWLAAVRDAFSNRTAEWNTSDRCDTSLVLGALEYGIWSREVRDGELIHRSGRVSAYTSIRFAKRWRTTECCRRWARSATPATTR